MEALGRKALAAYRAAVAACDPEPLVRRALVDLRDEPMWVVALGKAAAAMARGVPRVERGVVVVPRGAVPRLGHRSRRLRVLEAGHPVPDHRSIDAGRRIVRVLDDAGRAGVVLLLSGGASSLACCPAPRLRLAEFQELTRRLLGSGLTIREINTVRKHVDLLKGGGLATRFVAPIRTVILSDVVGDDPTTIGSGPSVPDPTTVADARAILDKARLSRWARYLGESSKPCDFVRPARVTVIANHETLAHAAGRCLRLDPRTHVTARVDALARRYARELRARRPFVDAGEPVLRVRGDGRGGRAQHLALLVAREIAGRPRVAFLAAGSDGVDGPTDAVGAIVTGETWPEAERRGLDPARALREFDSYRVHDALGTHVKTGPTGTNVNDLMIGLVA